MVLSGVGATLRDERLRRQLTLEEVSRVTRISARYLDAIEKDRPHDLPGPVFARGFVQQYARFLQLPDEALLARLPKVDIENSVLPTPPVRERRPFWIPSTRRRFLRAGSVLLAAGLAVAAWIHFDFTSALQRSARNAWASAISQRRLPQPVAKSTPPPVQKAPLPTAGAVKAPVTVPATIPASTIQVLLTANANAWVQVTADGKSAFTGLLHANDSREVSGKELIKVMTGNAGGLRISLNGRTLDPIGPAGQVRTVRLTAEGLLPDPKNSPVAPDPL